VVHLSGILLTCTEFLSVFFYLLTLASLSYLELISRVLCSLLQTCSSTRTNLLYLESTSLSTVLLTFNWFFNFNIFHIIFTF
jgi:hypothetical protein